MALCAHANVSGGEVPKSGNAKSKLYLYTYDNFFRIKDTHRSEYKSTRFTGTTIKDTWTKPRGRVEAGEGGGFGWGGVEGWDGKAYNWN